MRPPQSVIMRPLLTEKSARLRETGGAASTPAEGEAYGQKLVFEVARDANKIEIRNAIEALFKVKVTGVHTMVQRGKEKRVGRSVQARQRLPERPKRARQGFSGRRPSVKKAVVTLKAGENIEFFEGV